MAPIRPLAWEPPHAAGVAQEIAKRQKKKKELLLMKQSLLELTSMIMAFVHLVPPLPGTVEQFLTTAALQGSCYYPHFIGDETKSILSRNIRAGI